MNRHAGTRPGDRAGPAPGRTLAPALALGAALLLGSPPGRAAQNEPRDVAAIRDIVERFRTAIIAKDVAAFSRLFYSENPDEVVWQFVVDDPRLARIQKAKPEARKTRRVPGNNYRAAIEAIAAEPRATEETFDAIRIDTDGEVGSVNFDYEYRLDGRVNNRGREMWHLVRTDRGWRIISVIYSARDPLPAATVIAP